MFLSPFFVRLIAVGVSQGDVSHFGLANSLSAVLSRLISRYTTKKTRRVTYVLHDLRPLNDPSLDSALRVKLQQNRRSSELNAQHKDLVP